MHANLFTSAFQAKLLVWRRLRQWSLVWLALVLVGGAWALVRVPSLSATRERLEAAQARSEPTRVVLGEIEGMERELAAEAARTERLLPFGPDRRPPAVLGALAEATRASGGRLYLRSVQYSNTASPTAATTAAPATVKGSEIAAPTLVVEGVSLDDESLDRFVQDLVDTGEVSHVELKSSVREAAPAVAPAPSGASPAGVSPTGASAAGRADPRPERLRFEIHCRA
jgi:hypothetical protein